MSNESADITRGILAAQAAAKQAATSAQTSQQVALQVQLLYNAMLQFTTTWKGPWDTGAFYRVNESVSYAGSSFIAIQNGSNNQPDVSPTFWNVVAEGGSGGSGGVHTHNGIGGDGSLGTPVGLSAAGPGTIKSNLTGGSAVPADNSLATLTAALPLATTSVAGIMAAADKIRLAAAVVSPAVVTTVLHVSPTGSNTNDGRSWFSPKKTVLGAYDTLTSGGGTIYFESGSAWSDGTEGGGVVANNPLWLVDGPVVPPGWRAYKPVSIVGMPSLTSGGFNTSGLAELNITPVTSDRFKSTAIWLVGPCIHFTLKNVRVNGFPGTVLRAAWDYPRDSSGNLISSNVTNAVRSGGQTVLTLSLRTYSPTLASRFNGFTTLKIPSGAGLPQGTLPISFLSVIDFTSTNVDFPSGTFQCTAAQGDGTGGGIVKYVDPGPDLVVPESIAGSTFTTHGMGVNDRLDLTSSDANFPSTMYRIVAATLTTVTVIDPYTPSSHSNTNIGTATFQDRFNFANDFMTIDNCFGLVGGTNAADVFWRGPAVDLGTSNFGGFSVFDRGSSWSGYFLESPNVCLDPDRSAAVLLDGGAIGAPVYCAEDFTTQQGGIRAYLGNTGVLIVRDMLTDVAFGTINGPPCVEVFVNPGAQSTALVDLVNVQSADNSGTTPNVALHGTVPSNTHTRMCGLVSGPSTSISDASAQTWTGLVSSAPAQGQIGFWAGNRIAGDHPGSRLSFSPQTPRARNLLGNSTTWNLAGATLTPGIDAPDGTATAFRFVPDGSTSNPVCYVLPVGAIDPHTGGSMVSSIGDRWAFFMWFRKHSGSGAFVNEMAFQPNIAGGAQVFAIPDYLGDGGWQWVGGSAIVAAVPGGSGSAAPLRAFIGVNDNFSEFDFWGVVCLRVPVGVMTDDEWAQTVMTLRNLPYYLNQGSCGTMEGQKLIGHGGLGVDASVLSNPGTADSTVAKWEPRYAADGTTVQGYAPLFSAAARDVVNAQARAGAALTNADITKNPATDSASFYALPPATLTADHVLTLGVGGSPVTGSVVQISRRDLTAHSYTINDDAASPLFVFGPSPASAQGATFFFNGTHYAFLSFYYLD